MNYYDETTINQLRSYKTQIVVLFISILAILLSVSVLNDLYNQTLNRNANLSNQIFLKSKTAALIYTLVSFYFLYLTYNAYMKNKTRTNFMFVLASLLFFIAAFLRYLNINQSDISNSGDII